MFGAPRRGLPAGGSFSNTSIAAPEIVPARRASANAASWTISPRAQFTRIALRLIFASSAAPIFDEAYPGLSCGGGGQVWVVGDHGHPEGLGPLRHVRAEPAAPPEAEGL